MSVNMTLQSFFSSCNKLTCMIRKINVFQELGFSLVSSWIFRFPLITLCH